MTIRPHHYLLLPALLAAAAGCTTTMLDEDALAQAAACGDAFHVANPDREGNTRAPAELLCDEAAGEVLVGVLYRERVDDGMDGPGLLCRRPDGTVRRVIEELDLGPNTNPDLDSACPAGEQLIGVAYKDVDASSSHTADAADGVAAICANGPGPEPADLTSNPLPYQKLVCPTGSEAVGVAYADRDAATHSDLVDHVTVICRESCANSCEPGDPAEVANADAGGNTRTPAALVCDVAAGEVLVGTLYRERAYDGADGPGLLCRRLDGTVRRVILEADLGLNPDPDLDSACPAGQRVIGVGYKDVAGDWIHTRDTTDGVVAICDGGRGPEPADVASNPLAYQDLICPDGNDAIGLVYGDRDAEVNSDLVDFVTVLCQDRCAP